MVLVGIGGILLGIRGYIRAGNGYQKTKKEVYAWYEQAFFVLNKMFIEHHAQIYKDEKAQQILFYHTDIFLSNMQTSQKAEIYAIHQPGIYEDIRFLCSLVASRSQFLDVLPPLPAQLSSKRIQQAWFIFMVIISLFVVFSSSNLL